MITTLTLIPAHSGTESSVHMVDLAEKPTFDAIGTAVEPLLGFSMLDTERVNVFQAGSYTDLFVHDSGALLGLPRNERATAIYRHNVLAHEPGTDPESLPAIYGPAVLSSRRIWF